MGGWLSIPTCIAQFHSVYTRAACSFRLVKMNNKCDVVAEARGRGGGVGGEVGGLGVGVCVCGGGELLRGGSCGERDTEAILSMSCSYVCVCVCACVRACVRACVCVCVNCI